MLNGNGLCSRMDMNVVNLRALFAQYLKICEVPRFIVIFSALPWERRSEVYFHQFPIRTITDVSKNSEQKDFKKLYENARPRIIELSNFYLLLPTIYIALC